MSTALSQSLPSPPSRRDNPFATCWTRPGKIPFRFAAGESIDRLVAELSAQNWRGAIIGPHGSGKSTLLESLRPAILAAGKDVRCIDLHDGQRNLPAGFAPAPVTRNLVMIIDGYAQLSWLERWRLARACGRSHCGLLVTAHSPTRYPTLLSTSPNFSLIAQLAADLCVEVSTSITREDVAASHAIHGSNVREIFFDLYDRHEKQRRLLKRS